MIGLGADQLDDIPRQDACSNAPALPLGAVWRIEKPDRALGECQPHESQEAAYQLVEARPDPPALLQPAHAALHRAPAPGGAAVEPEAAVAQGRVAALKDHRIDPAPGHPAPHPSAAVAPSRAALPGRRILRGRLTSCIGRSNCVDSCARPAVTRPARGSSAPPETRFSIGTHPFFERPCAWSSGSSGRSNFESRCTRNPGRSCSAYPGGCEAP